MTDIINASINGNGRIMKTGGTTINGTGNIVANGDLISMALDSATIVPTTKFAVPQGSIGLDQLTSELREYLGLPDTLEVKKCGKCQEEKVMDESDYLCKGCRYG